MAKAWRAGKIEAPTMEDYIDVASEIIRLTPPDIIYHRVSATARRPTLLSPMWCEPRWLGLTNVGMALNKDGAQGSLINTPFKYTIPVLKK